MEFTADVIVFLVATVIILAVSLYASMVLRGSLENGVLAREYARRHLAEECDAALECANAGAVIAFSPNARTVRALMESAAMAS